MSNNFIPQNFLRKVSKNWHKILRKIAIPFIYIENKPIFILGNQKSGTTAIAALLALHTGSSITLDLGGQMGRLTSEIKTKELPFTILQKYYKYEFSKKIIKDLWLTFLFDELKSSFPNAIFIQIIRDPRDTIRSILNRLNIPGNLENIDKNMISVQNSGWYYVLENSWLNITNGNYIEILAQRWNYCIDTYLKNIDNIILVKYEDFLSDKIDYISRLAEELGLAHRQDISDKIDFQFQPAGNSKISWINFFGEKNLHGINEICKDRIKKIGYPEIKL